jgi:hypothetical protein
MAAPFLQDIVGDGDLAPPLKTLLEKLGFLATDAAPLDEGAVIKASATRLSKLWAVAAGGAGGTVSFGSLIGAITAAKEPTKVALIAAAAVALAATAIAVALIVRSDLAARAAVTSALFQSRRELTETLIAAARGATGATAGGGGDLAALLASVDLKVPGEPDSKGVTGLRKRDGHRVEVRRGDGDWVALPAGIPTFELELTSRAAG